MRGGVDEDVSRACELTAGKFHLSAVKLFNTKGEVIYGRKNYSKQIAHSGLS